MVHEMYWDPCISHRGSNVVDFIKNYFDGSQRRLLLIAGAGFDPRSHKIPKLIAQTGVSVDAVFVQEVRPGPDESLVQRGVKNAEVLSDLFPGCKLEKVKVFDTDNAVTGGRNAINLISKYPLNGVTDVVVDISALSVGISFPTIRYFHTLLSGSEQTANLHVFVAHDPALDGEIKPIAGDSPTFIHGFRGNWGLESAASAAKLWLPQLAKGRVSAMRRLFEFVGPDDICPILPFPSENPRMGDDLAEHYLEELDGPWAVDGRNLIYAAEDDPLDLYRTILKIDDRRKPVFAETGGSQLVLSPSGSKVLSLGALLAALDRNLPIAYLESVGYEFREAQPSAESSECHLVHVWLGGSVYPSPE